MSDMTALITAPFHKEGLSLLRAHMPLQYESWKETGRIYTDPGEFIEKIRSCDARCIVVEGDQVDGDIIDACGLELIASCRGNPVNIDIDAATERGVPVLFTPARNADAVADLTVALMLAQARHLTRADRLLRGGEFYIDTEDDLVELYRKFTGFELGGVVVGIIGLGQIGLQVARRLKGGFGSRLLACDPYAADERFAEAGAEKVELDELLRKADIVTLHVAATPETERMIGPREIELMKPSALFINTSRAFCTDENALYQALKSGRIAGAGLDVFDSEPVESDNRFLSLDNVTVTPHIAGVTVDGIKNQSKSVADDIVRFLRGERPRHIKNPEVLERHSSNVAIDD